MTPKVDKNTCIACQTCVSICPEVFEIQEDGKAGVKADVNYEEFKEKIEQSKNSCPVSAISIE